jgi:hypothetical protein
MRARLPITILATVAGLVGAVAIARADVKAEIKDVMLSVNQGPTSVVGQLREAFNQASLDDDGWEAAKARAAMVVEASRLLEAMKPAKGAADDAGLATWKKHVADYRGCGEAAHAAASSKDLAAGKAAMASMMKRCAECHKDHRGE